MIKLLTRCLSDDVKDVNYTKISANLEAYGKQFSICTAWSVGDGFLCRVDGNMTLYGENFDADELREFLAVSGAKTLSCSASAAQKLGYEYTQTNVLICEKGFRSAVNSEPSLDEVFALLKNGEDGDISLPSREAFIADLSHRIRHGTAKAYTYKSAVCVVPYITKSAALICGVATDKADRGCGFAGLLVRSAVADINKPCFVVCSQGVVPFYKKFGFNEVGKNALVIF